MKFLLSILLLIIFKSASFSQEETICQRPDVEAQYFGGRDSIFTYLEMNLVYPEIAIKNGEEGKVAVAFIVERNGSISNVSIINGVCASINKEAIRLVSEMSTWKPAISGESTCRSKIGMTMDFSLDYEKARRKRAKKARRKRRKF